MRPHIFTFAFLLLAPVLTFAATPVAECDAGKLYKFEDVPVVVVEGTWFEMGKQYGTLLKKEMKAFSATMEIGLLAMIGQEKFGRFVDLAEAQLRLYPKRFQEIHRGMSEGSGLSLRKIAVLEHYIAADIAVGSGLFCSSVSVWGDFTTDGTLIMGRNFDFPNIYLQGSPYFCVAVFRPTDGSVPCATLGYVGEIGSVNMFNGQGLVAEVNVAVNLPQNDSAICLDRITAPITLTALGFDCDGLTQSDAALRTYRFNFPLLCTVADSAEARTYEIGTRDMLFRKPDEPGLNTVTNWASDPDWDGVKENTYDQRRTNLQSLARRHKGGIDAGKMKEIMETKTDDGGATILFEDRNFIFTVHQFVYTPAKRELSIRQPSYKKNPNWIDIDLKPFFAKQNP